MGNRDFLDGQVLIAMPNMSDPSFEHSLVLMCSHDADHAMGVVINKPIDGVCLTDLLSQLDIEHQKEACVAPVFRGGPVQKDRGLVVHSLDVELSGTLPITDEIGITGTKEILHAIAGNDAIAPAHYVMALGHAGWTGGQLEDEIAMNAWSHTTATSALIFQSEPSNSWMTALETLGVPSTGLTPEWFHLRDDSHPLH